MSYLKTEEAGGNQNVPINYTANPESYERQPGESTVHYYGRRLTAIKPVEILTYEATHSGMKRALGRWDLIFVGIGAIIGTGIFVLSGHAAANNAGPAVVISFIIAGFAAALASLSYSELAAMIPVAGSAYTYSYATMGEFVAWIIGWDLILEYAVGAATVAVGWSGYFVAFFHACGVELSPSWTKPPLGWDEATQSFTISPTSHFNVPGFVVVILLTIVLTVGIRESAMVNNVVVVLKLIIVLIFIFGSAKWVDPKNWQPFVPPTTDGDWHHFGVAGIFAAAQQIFFAYIGFDAVTTAALESRDPPRDLPIGIIGSLIICTILYIVVALVLTGVSPYQNLNVAAPVAVAAAATGQQWLLIIVTLGALAGLTSVMLILLLGQPRIFYSMAKDGLLPSIFTKLHPRFKTPYVPTIITGVITAFLGALLPVDLLGNMTSVGTLLAFFLVHVGVLILRFTRPDIPRPFKIPGAGFLWMPIPIVGAAISVLLIAVSDVTTIWRVFIWMAIGFLIYACYGFWHSKINTDPKSAFEQLDEPEDAVI
ncbi:amino acid permease-domain-containing protein [Jimgerdemannia flammicorona]|uniref:Amino acid permease-domain-containing protein n=2 Tax=Jimgerdemannia flammicorona TaxID=994334 RepID=A0A433D514_9FUNG|nr:amino acid permease-domain-containing protein [Jimgerdemannia flammicorona]RUS28687.1 amino acid permease-domain-containing protein [Jimgerdemannia flammicorona]